MIKNNDINIDIYNSMLAGLSRKALEIKFNKSKTQILYALKKVDSNWMDKKPEKIRKENLGKIGEKDCKGCGKAKDLSEFYSNGNGQVRYKCNKCSVKIKQEKYYRDHEKSKSRLRKYHNNRYKNDPIYKEKVIASNYKYINDPKNKQKIKKFRSDLSKFYRKNNPSFKITENLRRVTRKALNGQKRINGFWEVTGCSPEFLRSYLESKFKEGMNWDNYGAWKLGESMTWHVDHIKPCAHFDLTQPEQQKECFHYTNLQPLWAIDNLRKYKFYQESHITLDWSDWQI